MKKTWTSWKAKSRKGLLPIEDQTENWKAKIHNSYENPNERPVLQFYHYTTKILLLHSFFFRRNINNSTIHLWRIFSRIWSKPYGAHNIKSQVDQTQ